MGNHSDFSFFWQKYEFLWMSARMVQIHIKFEFFEAIAFDGIKAGRAVYPLPTNYKSIVIALCRTFAFVIK